MTFSVLLFLSVATLIFTVYYAWWTKIRVVKLRQDIYDRRDDLFDVAAELNAFDDPSYVAARSHLNGMLDLVKYFSVQSVEYMIKIGHLAPATQLKSNNKVLQYKIDETFEWLVRRISRYLIQETLSGFLVYATYGIEPDLRKAVTEETQQKVRTILYSDVLAHWQLSNRISSYVS